MYRHHVRDYEDAQPIGVVFSENGAMQTLHSPAHTIAFLTVLSARTTL